MRIKVWTDVKNVIRLCVTFPLVLGPIILGVKFDNRVRRFRKLWPKGCENIRYSYLQWPVDLNKFVRINECIRTGITNADKSIKIHAKMDCIWHWTAFSFVWTPPINLHVIYLVLFVCHSHCFLSCPLLFLLMKYLCPSLIRKGAAASRVLPCGEVDRGGRIRTRNLQVEMRQSYPLGHRRT